MTPAGPSGYELSSEYLRGFAHSAEKQGWLAQVPWSPAMVEMLAKLDTASWWPPVELEQWGTRLLELRGEQAIELIGYHLSIRSIAPIMKVTSKLSRGAPAAVLKQFTVVVADSIRGVGVRFEPLGAGSGTFVVTYPTRNPPRANGLLWKGTLRRVGESLAGAELTSMRDEAGTFRFGFTWPQPARP